MKRLLFLLSIIYPFVVESQTITDVVFCQAGQTIEVKYNIIGARQNQYFNIDLYVSTDGGKTYKGPLKQVTGDVGLALPGGTGKKIVWDVFNEMPEFGGQVAFDVRAVVVEEQKTSQTKVKDKKKDTGHHFFIGYNGSNTSPIGLITGVTGKVGFYISGRLNPGLFTQYTYETNNNGIIENYGTGYYSFNSTDKDQRLSVTAGLQFKLGNSLNFYVGGGLAKSNLLWQVEQYDYPEVFRRIVWAKNTDESFLSAEAEAGLMLKFNHLFLAAGVSSPGFQWVDATFSAGIIF